MLDPRIYRTGLVVVALAAVVLAFSLQNQPAGLSSSLAPDAFNGQNVYASMTSIAAGDPDRRPGSAGDFALAAQVASSLIGEPLLGLEGHVHRGHCRRNPHARERDRGQTRDGERQRGHRGAARFPRPAGDRRSVRDAGLSGTSALIELGRDLAGETLNRTVVLASTSGTQGAAGALRLASTLAGPIDAVIVLGDLASAHAREPIVVPWSNSTAVAPPALRNTLAGALGAQASLAPGGTGFAGQFAHLAFPLTVSAQGPFGAHGIPAVLLSLSGERGPAPDAALGGEALVTSLGRAVLQTISALDSGPSVPAPTPYLLLNGKVIPGWAISLFVLALIVPVLLATIDGLARARRRNAVVWRWILLVLAAAVPFALAAAVVLGAKLIGWLNVAPPGPLPAGAVPLSGPGIPVLAIAACAALAALVLLRPLAVRLGIGARTPAGSRNGLDAGDATTIGGGAVALMLVMVLVTIAVWLANPFAALLLVPALHLWLPAVNSRGRLHAVLRLALILAGLVPLGLIAAYYSVTLGFSLPQAVWTATLLVAGGGVTPLAVLEWSVVLGCALSAVVIVALAARQPRPQAAPITVRGPLGYAGPGSLGGTESALRR